MKGITVQPSKISRCLGIEKSFANKISKIINKTEVSKNSHIKITKDMDISLAILTPHDDLAEYTIDNRCLVFQFGMSHIFIPIEILTEKIKITHDSHYQVYIHAFFEDGDRFSSISYTGMTGRNIWLRFAEHKKANSFFGRSMQKVLDGTKKGFIYHTIISDGLTKKEALDLEGKVINEYSLYPDGHNIMPGGMEGVEYAKKYGLGNYENASDKLSQIVDSPDDLERLCAKKYNWKPTSDEDKTNRVCNNQWNFSKEEIRFIRICSLSTKRFSKISLMFKDNFPEYENTYTTGRIKKVVTGETYRFVT